MKTTTSYRVPGGALLPLAAALLALAAPLTAAPRFVMEIRDHDGNLAIAGESDAPGHPGSIEVVSFGKGFTPSTGGFPTADTTGIECGIITDKATPKLLEALTHGMTLPVVELFYLGDDNQPLVERTAHMRLEHVQVIEMTHGFGSVNPLGPAFAAGPPVAHLTLNFSKITWIYRQFDGNGTLAYQDGTTHAAHEPTEDPAFDDDNDGVPNDLDEDDDNDQIPDEHETRTGTNALVDDAGEDLDDDKQSNRDEWLAGTKADDATSFFAISALSIARGPEGRTATVSFPVIAERRYRLLGTPNPALPRESWIEFDAFDTPTGSPDSEAEVVLTPAILPQLGRMVFAVEVDRSAR